MKIINKFLIALVGLTAFSCKDFLSVKPEHMIPLDGAMESVEDCEKFRIGLYDSFKSSGGFAGTSVVASDIQCDYVLPVMNNKQTFAFETNWTFNSQNFAGASTWGAFNSTIFKANFILANVPNVISKLKAELPENPNGSELEAFKKDSITLEKIMSEAHMARALSRVEMVKLFADAYEPSKASETLAVPVWDEIKIGNPIRPTMDKFYEAVLADISNAEETITDNAPDNIFFTRAAVQLLKARVYLYMQNWEGAVEAATQAMSGSHTLLSAVPDGNQSVQETPYAKMWSSDKGNEIIWKIAFTNSDESVSSYAGVFCALTGNNELRPDYVVMNSFINELDPRDNRNSIFYQKKQTDYSHQLEAYLLTKFPGNPDLNRASSAPRYGNMPKVMRLAEVYLIRAEAYARLNNEALANADLNALRAKRLSNYTDQTFSGDQLLTEIKNERKRELVMEGHRLYDLKRFKEGFARVHQDQVQTQSSSISVTPDNLRFTWPIPSSEFDVPGSVIQKNPSNDL